MAEVRMPKMGDGMVEGTITAWLKKVGDHVDAGEPIAEVETDKANVEISAYETGILSQIVVPEGGTVPVGEIIAQIGEGAASGNGAHASTAAPSLPAEPASAPAIIKEVPSEASAAPDTERIKASPLARKMADEMGIDLARITGSGPGGRIVERDIKKFQDQHPGMRAQVSPAPAAATKPAGSAPAAPAPFAASSAPAASEEIKPTKMREAIARRTVQSKQNTPHFYVSMIVEMDRAQALLKEINADTPDTKITVNDLIVKACSSALLKVPDVNSSWTAEGTIRRYSETHIGIAVGLPEGLIVPVIKNCQSKGLRQISAEAKIMINKARNNQLKPEDYSGGTFSVSNLGMMGVDEFIAIINPPEAAILAIGGISREPVVLKDSDEIVIRAHMKIILSADHRLLDGVSGAKFLQEVKKALESPFSLLS